MQKISSLLGALKGEQHTTPELSLLDMGENMFDDHGLVTDEAMGSILALYRQGERYVTDPKIVNPTKPFKAPSVPTPLEDPPLVKIQRYEDYIAKDIDLAIWQRLLQLEAVERVLKLREEGVTGAKFVVEALADPVIYAHLMELARRVMIEGSNPRPFLIDAFHSAATQIARTYDETYGDNSDKQSYLRRVFQNGKMYLFGYRDKGKFGNTTVEELFQKHKDSILP